MAKKDTVKFISLFLNGVILSSLFFGIIWADSNGVWTLSSDIRGGTFGSDEQPISNFTFINPVYFYNKLNSNNINYFINISGRTQLYDLATQKINSNQGQINGNFKIQSNLTLENNKNCNGKLYTDSSGKVLCGAEKLQNLNSVLSVGNDAGGQRLTNVANPINGQDVATKSYVDTNSGHSLSTRIVTYTRSAWRWPSGTANCNSNEIVVGGGASCTSSIGYMVNPVSKPVGNGWYASCDTTQSITATIVVYAVCLKK